MAPARDRDRALTLVVLAAGASRRYGLPKQLAPIGPGGEALLEYSAFDALRAGFSRVVVVVRPGSQAAVRRRFQAMTARVPVAFAPQDPASPRPSGDSAAGARSKPWGTGHAVLCAEGEISGPFAAINADDFYGAESFAALGRFLRAPVGAGALELAMVGFRVRDTLSPAGPVSRALCRLDGEGYLLDVVEAPEVRERRGRPVYREPSGAETALRGDEIVSMNMWGLRPEIFAPLRAAFEAFQAHAPDGDEELLLPDVLGAWVRERRARIAVLPGARTWCGLTFRADERRARAVVATAVAAGRYPSELWA